MGLGLWVGLGLRLRVGMVRVEVRVGVGVGVGVGGRVTNPTPTPDPHPNPKQAPVTRWWARARGWTACRGRASRRRTMTSSTPVSRCVPGSPFAALPEHCAAPRSQWQCVLPYGFSLSLRDVFLPRPSGANQVCRDFVAACMLHMSNVCLERFLFAKVLKILISLFGLSRLGVACARCGHRVRLRKG